MELMKELKVPRVLEVWEASEVSKVVIEMFERIGMLERM